MDLRHGKKARIGKELLKNRNPPNNVGSMRIHVTFASCLRTTDD